MSYYRDLLSNLDSDTSQHGFAASSLHNPNESSTPAPTPTKNPSSLSIYESLFLNSSLDYSQEVLSSLEPEPSELGAGSEFDIFSTKRTREVVSEAYLSNLH